MVEDLFWFGWKTSVDVAFFRLRQIFSLSKGHVIIIIPNLCHLSFSALRQNLIYPFSVIKADDSAAKNWMIMTRRCASATSCSAGLAVLAVRHLSSCVLGSEVEGLSVWTTRQTNIITSSFPHHTLYLSFILNSKVSWVTSCQDGSFERLKVPQWCCMINGLQIDQWCHWVTPG